MEHNSETMEYAISSIPKEVQDYIFGFRFSKELASLFEKHGFSEKEKNDFELKLYGYLAQLDTEESLIETIHSISKTPEMSQSIMSWVKEKVTDPVFDIAVSAAVVEEESEEKSAEAAIEKNPSPTQALESIKTRLSQSSAIVPTTRDYSVDKIQAPNPTEKSTIDPYREAPEK